MRLNLPVAVSVSALFILASVAGALMPQRAYAWTSPATPEEGMLLAKAKKPKKTRSGKTIVDDNTILANSSEANREDKEWELVAELIGYSVAPIPSAGFTGGYYLQPDMIVELNYAKGEADVLIFKVESEAFSARLKKFWGNSFYTNSGLGMRSISASYTLDPLVGTADYDGKAESKSVVLDVAIGNMWQFENFAIGCDWIGAMVPLAKLSTSVDEPAGADPKDADDAKKDFDKIALTGTAQLLRFYIGASF